MAGVQAPSNSPGRNLKLVISSEARNLSSLNFVLRLPLRCLNCHLRILHPGCCYGTERSRPAPFLPRSLLRRVCVPDGFAGRTRGLRCEESLFVPPDSPLTPRFNLPAQAGASHLRLGKTPRLSS